MLKLIKTKVSDRSEIQGTHLNIIKAEQRRKKEKPHTFDSLTVHWKILKC